MELNFTPRSVKEIEDRSKRPVTELLSKFSVSTLALLVEKGAKLDNEDQALDMIEKHFAEEGGDMFSLYVDIMERLQVAGFFPRKLDLTKVREQLAGAMEKGIDTLETTGSEESQQQSE